MGGGGGVWLVSVTTRADRVDIAGDYLVLLGPFIGLVLAGLTLVITLLSERYARLLAEAQDGMLTFLRPLIIALGVQVWALLGLVAYRAAADEVRERFEHVAFVALSLLFVYGVLEILAIVRNLNGHALLLSQQARTEDVEAQSSTPPAPRKPVSSRARVSGRCHRGPEEPQARLPRGLSVGRCRLHDRRATCPGLAYGRAALSLLHSRPKMALVGRLSSRRAPRDLPLTSKTSKRPPLRGLSGTQRILAGQRGRELKRSQQELRLETALLLRMPPAGIEPAHAVEETAALSTELRGQVAQCSDANRRIGRR